MNFVIFKFVLYTGWSKKKDPLTWFRALTLKFVTVGAIRIGFPKSKTENIGEYLELLAKKLCFQNFEK